MTAFRLTLAVGAVLAASAALASPWDHPGFDDATYPSREAPPARPAAPKPPVQVSITIRDDGPHPAVVQAAAGRPIVLVVTRETNRLCTDEIVVPSFHLRTRLPYGKPVTISLPASGRGDIRLECPREDGAGQVVVN